MVIERVGSSSEAETIQEQILDSPLEKAEPVEFFHTGSVNLNLAGSQKGASGGMPRGRITNIVGDGSSGKTILAIEGCHWVYRNIWTLQSSIYAPTKVLSIVYNNAETVMDFPISNMYGQDFFDFVEWDAGSTTVQHMGRDLTRRLLAMGEGDSLVYVVDSWDALDSEEGEERFIRSAKEDVEIDGSYNVEKQAYGSKQFFKNLCGLMAGKDATIIIVSQTRKKIGISFGSSVYRGGGAALDFYTHQVPWLSVIKQLSVTKDGLPVVYGVRVRANFKRNKVAKPFRQAEFEILFNHGVDNIGSILNYLYGYTKTGEPKGKVSSELEYDGHVYTRRALINYIQTNNYEWHLEWLCEKKFLASEQSVEDDHSRKRKW